MARIRTIKPEFFKNKKLYRAERESGFPLRIAFAGLWTCADREGRFRWKPDEIQLDVLPWDEGIEDFEAVMVALEKIDAIRSYVVDGRKYGYIPAWSDHQAINVREAQSVLPAPPSGTSPTHEGAAQLQGGLGEGAGQRTAIACNSSDAAHEEGKGREGKGKEGKDASRPDASPSPDGAGFSLSPVNGKSRTIVGGNPITLKSFFARCQEAHIEPIPPDDPVFGYADKAGIPEQFVHLAWKEFRRKHIEAPKKYANWRQAFRNCIEQNWYKLWTVDQSDQYVLTGAGRQAQRVHGK